VNILTKWISVTLNKGCDMKKIWPYLLVVLLMPAIISSCKKDRNPEPPNVE